MEVSFAVTLVTLLGIINSSGAEEFQSRRACEGKPLQLRCLPGTYIDVLHAMYGRDRGPSVCNHDLIQTTSCRSGVSLARAWGACQGRSSCALSASNSVFGDPCPGTYKFLRVEYRCSQIRRSRICEGGTLHLVCPQGQTLNIVRASYGRNEGPEVCPHSSIRQISNCRAASSLTVVSRNCDGRPSCFVRANNGVFGDPCEGTYKYLEVSYRCA